MVKRDFTRLTPDEKINGIKATKLPDYFRTKYHGGDVRETFAQLSELTIQLGINMGLSPDDAISWARKLQEAIPRSEFDSWVATLLDGGPSIFMNTLTELQTTYPNGAPGVALVRATDPAKIYVWNGTSWEDFGDYQGIEIKDGTVTSDKLADKTVTASKTDFAKRSEKNLFDGIYHDKRIVYPAPLTVGEGGKSAIVKVEPNTNYTVYKSKDTSIFRVFHFEEYPEIGSVPTREITKDTAEYIDIVTSGSEKYLMVVVTSSSENLTPSELQVSTSDVLEYHEPNLLVFNADFDAFPNGAISGKKAKFFERSKKNIFDGDYIVGLVDLSTKTILKRRDNGTTSIVAVVPVDGLSEYTITKSQDTNALQLGLFNTYPNYGAVATRVIDLSNAKVSSVQTDSDTVYLAIQVASSSDTVKTPEILQVEKGDSSLPEQPYVLSESAIPSSIRELTTTDEITTTTDEIKWLVSDIAPGMYKSTVPTSDLELTYGTNVNALYAEYDTLVSEFPDYVKRELFTTDASGTPVYLYRFTPPNLGSYMGVRTEPYELPKFLTVTGTHGGDIRSIEVAVAFYKDLCRNWQSNDQLKLLRWNVDLLVIPCLSPAGFGILTGAGRLNANGVNINRNFTQGWNPQHELGHQDYQGESPLSEVESQALVNLIENNRDIAFALDFHHFGAYPDINPSFSHMYVNNEKVIKLAQSVYNYKNQDILINYPSIPRTVKHPFHIRREDPIGMTLHAFDGYSITGGILEIAGNDIVGVDRATVRKVQTEIYGNFMIEAYRNINSL